MKLATTLFFAFLLTTSLVHGQTWIEMDSMPPGNGLLKPFSFSINGMLYVGGGDDTSNHALNTFFMYDPSSNTWTQKANIPTALYATGDFVLHGKGYVACGSLPGPSNLVYMYDPTTDTWTQKNNFPGTPRENGVGFSFNGKGYISGGFVGVNTLTNDMWQYNDSTDTWTQMANVPGPTRNGPMFLVISNQAFIGLGNDVSGSTYYSDFYEFNPDSNTYSRVADIPVARGSGANFTLGNYGYVGLGVTANGVVNDFYIYDPVVNTWTLTNNFGGLARAHVFNEVVAGVPYVGCGNDSAGAYLSDNWAFGYPTGIKDITTDNSVIKCYPSPTSESFTIDMSGYGTGEKQITIYDDLGQAVYQTLTVQDKVQINNRFSTGLYNISVIQGMHKDYAKVILE